MLQKLELGRKVGRGRPFWLTPLDIGEWLVLSQKKRAQTSERQGLNTTMRREWEAGLADEKPEQNPFFVAPSHRFQELSWRSGVIRTETRELGGSARGRGTYVEVPL